MIEKERKFVETYTGDTADLVFNDEIEDAFSDESSKKVSAKYKVESNLTIEKIVDNLDMLSKNKEILVYLALNGFNPKIFKENNWENSIDQSMVQAKIDRMVEGINGDYDLSIKICPILSHMEVNGVKFPKGMLEEVRNLLIEEISDIRTTLKDNFGIEPDYDQKIKYPEEVMFKIAELEKKEAKKKQIDSILENMDLEGVVKTNWNPYGTYSGRIISSAPSLQNISNKIKQYIIPKKLGNVIIELDIKTQEPWMNAILSQDKKALEILNSGEDYYIVVIRLIFNDSEIQVTEEQRAVFKRIFNGLSNGMTWKGILQVFKESKIFPTLENFESAKEIYDQYFQLFPELKNFLDLKKNSDVLYTENGTPIKSLMKETAKMSFSAQNMGANMLKKMMLYISEQEKDAEILLAIHDCLVLEVPEGRGDEIREYLEMHIREIYKAKISIKMKKIG